MKHLTLIIIVICSMTYHVIFGQNVNKPTKIAGVNLSQTITNSHDQKSSMSDCDTIFSFSTTPYPTGLTWDGQNLWYVDTNYIYKVNFSGLRLDSIHNPASGSEVIKGGGLTFDGTNLWFADEESAQLFKLNPTNGNIMQQFNLPSFGQSDPNGFGLAWDGINIWHSQYDPPMLYKLNPANGTIIDSLTTTAGLLSIEFMNGNFYGIRGQQLYRINVITGLFQDSTSWCIPFSLGLTWDGSHIWNVSGQDTILGIPTGGKQRIYKINSDFTMSVSEDLISNNDIMISPNPATDKISVKGEIINTIEIFNVTGKIMYSTTYTMKQATYDIDISHLPKGMYFIKINGDNTSYTGKILKQ
jgi:hypothetical protein